MILAINSKMWMEILLGIGQTLFMTLISTLFAYLFGIADKVAKQLKDMYPEIVEQTDVNGNVMFDYDMFMFVNHISMRSVSAASSARAAAESYSSGGGGFSSGGGGGGSFGGGGGGSR